MPGQQLQEDCFIGYQSYLAFSLTSDLVVVGNLLPSCCWQPPILSILLLLSHNLHYLKITALSKSRLSLSLSFCPSLSLSLLWSLFMNLERALVAVVHQEEEGNHRIPRLERGKVDHSYHWMLCDYCYTEKSVALIVEMLKNAKYEDGDWNSQAADPQMISAWKVSPYARVKNPSKQALEGTLRKYQDVLDSQDYFVPDKRPLRRHRFMHGELRLYDMTYESYRVVYTVDEVLDKVDADPRYMELLMCDDECVKLKHQLHTVENIICVEAAGLEFARDDRQLSPDGIIIPKEVPVVPIPDQHAFHGTPDGDRKMPARAHARAPARDVSAGDVPARASARAHAPARDVSPGDDVPPYDQPPRVGGFEQWEIEAMIEERRMDIEDRKLDLAEKNAAKQIYLDAFKSTQSGNNLNLDKLAIRMGFDELIMDE